MKKSNRFLKQYNVKYLGSFLHIVYLSLPILGIVAQVFTAATMYGVWRDSILWVFPWLTLPVFFILLFAFSIALLVLVFKFIYPSYWEFQNRQQFPEDGYMMRMIRKAVREELEEFGKKNNDKE